MPVDNNKIISLSNKRSLDNPEVLWRTHGSKDEDWRFFAFIIFIFSPETRPSTFKEVTKRELSDLMLNANEFAWLIVTAIGVNKTRSCVCFFTSDSDFFFTFPKNWVGRAMGNETFYGDGLKAFDDVPHRFWTV